MTAIIDHGTTRDGLIQLRRRWQPTAPARAAILLLHGLGEHSGRYEHVGDHLAARGFDVVSIDNRGFGRSGGRRAHVDRWSAYHDDIEDQLAQVRSLGLPTVLMGHSLGGLMATGYCLTDRPGPDALVVSGPALGIEDDPKIKLLTTLGPVIRKVAPGFENRDDWDATVFAEDITVGERFLLDPLRVDFMTISLAMETVGEIERVDAALADLDVPAFCQHGGLDKLVPAWASERLEQVGGATRRVYDDLGHEIYNEPVGSDVLDDAVVWIETALALAAD